MTKKISQKFSYLINENENAVICVVVCYTSGILLIFFLHFEFILSFISLSCSFMSSVFCRYFGDGRSVWPVRKLIVCLLVWWLVWSFVCLRFQLSPLPHPPAENSGIVEQSGTYLPRFSWKLAIETSKQVLCRCCCC